MKSLVVYYSLEGNTKLIAEFVAQLLNSDVLALKPKEEIDARSFMKYILGGKQVMTNEKPELVPYDINPKDYDFLVIGTPVWAWSYTPPLNTFFEKERIKNKRVAVFCCHGGGKLGALTKLKRALSGNEIVGEIDFREPLKQDREKILGIVKSWVSDLTRRLGPV